MIGNYPVCPIGLAIGGITKNEKPGRSWTPPPVIVQVNLMYNPLIAT